MPAKPKTDREKAVDREYAEMLTPPRYRQNAPVGAMPASKSQISQQVFQRNESFRLVLDAIRVIQSAMGDISQSMHDVDLRLQKFESKAQARK